MGKWVYFYRAVDSTGATIDFLLSAKRDEATAERFLEGQEAGRNPGLIKGQQAAEPKRWAGRTLRRRG
jgi:transposase-like protein